VRVDLYSSLMKNPTPRDFEDRLKIDRHNLDQELIEQPELFYRICEQYALAVSQRDQMNDRCKQVAAERLERWRAKLEAKSEKVTEARLKTLAAADPKYTAVVREYAEAARQVDQWLALKDSFGQRAWVLKDLVQLFVAGYFQSNSAGGDKRKVDAAQYDRNREKLAHGRERL
jgi:hypothetical protein